MRVCAMYACVYACVNVRAQVVGLPSHTVLTLILSAVHGLGSAMSSGQEVGGVFVRTLFYHR